MYGAGDVRIADAPDPAIHVPTDAIVRVVRAAICGSDLHPYRSMPATDQGRQTPPGAAVAVHSAQVTMVQTAGSRGCLDRPARA